MPDEQSTYAVNPAPNGVRPEKTRLFVFLICLIVVAAGVIGAVVLIRTAPKAQKRPPLKMAPLVSVHKVYPNPQKVLVQAMGTVVPRRDLTLKSRVAGEVVHVHPEFIQGGVVRTGELLVRIDDMDYRLLVAQKQRAVAEADYALKIEMGRQDIARHEWDLLYGDQSGATPDADLALRKPHLVKAQADLAGAQAELKTAQLQLERTRIFAPFNAIVRSTMVEKGSQIAAQGTLASLAGTDEYWVEASVPVDRLKWIEIPDRRSKPGARTKIVYHSGADREGRVVKLLSDLEGQGRMARLVIAVRDPLSLERRDKVMPAMLIGEYVHVEIQGKQIDNAFRIPRSALRDNARVWVADQNDKLEIRQVRTIWRDSNSVLLEEGLQPGDRVVVSDLATPVPGMDLKIEESLGPTVTPAASDDHRANEG